MRAAQTRVGVIDSAGEVRRAVAGCAHALPVPVRFLKIGATAAAGTIGAGLLVRMLRSRHAVPAAAPSGWMRFLVSELTVGLLLPLCRSYLLASREDRGAEPRPGGWLSRLLKGH